VSGARTRAEAGKLAFGTVDSWLLWNLTGGQQHLTDVSNASRTMLLNIHTSRRGRGDPLLIKHPASLMPEVHCSSEVYGRVSPTLALDSIPIGGIAGDQQAALFGQMCIAPGLTKNTYGTGCFLLQNTGQAPKLSRKRLLTTIAWRVGERVPSMRWKAYLYRIGAAVVQYPPLRRQSGGGLFGIGAFVTSLSTKQHL
jgi:glycerol kinase